MGETIPPGIAPATAATSEQWAAARRGRCRRATGWMRRSFRWAEQFIEKLLQVLPGAFVRTLVVSGTLGLVITGHRLRETVNRVTIGDQLPVHLVVPHFTLKRGEVFG